jgi:hypothetical protein
LLTDKERFEVLPNDLAAVQRFVEVHARARRSPAASGAGA